MFYLHKSTSAQSPTRYAIAPIPAEASMRSARHVFGQTSYCTAVFILWLSCLLAAVVGASGDANNNGGRRDSQRMHATLADVFSFGVLTAAVFNGQAPYSTLQSAEIMFGVISGSLRPQLPPCLPAAVRYSMSVLETVCLCSLPPWVGVLWMSLRGTQWYVRISVTSQDCFVHTAPMPRHTQRSHGCGIRTRLSGPCSKRSLSRSTLSSKPYIEHD
jgi:hypothetical protein